MKRTLINAIASTLDAYRSCIKSGNEEWEYKHRDLLKEYEDMLPSGSGVDNGTQIDIQRSKNDKIVLHTAFHHMDEGGGYDGWTEHSIVITPSLVFGFHMKITGRDRNGIKDYLAEMFNSALSEEIQD